jgi:hypothetical protein
MEVNFIGSHEETDHTFHNTDRFMRALGFDLFGLTVRPYSLAALPARYQLRIAAQTESGRPVQGDALYVLDLGDPARSGAARALSAAKLAKLSAIYACFGLRDCAAEVLLTHRDRLADLLDVDEVLNLLAEEAQGRTDGRHVSYDDYIGAFQRDDPWFYPGERRALEPTPVPPQKSKVTRALNPDRPRIVCTIPPTDWFGGRDNLGAKVLTDALAELGHELFLLETGCFLAQDQVGIDQAVRRIRAFEPDFAIATPNAGYGLSVCVDRGGEPKNLFTDILGIPLALCWDDPLGQFASHFLAPLPATPAESRPGALRRLRDSVNHPLLFHYAWDTGHIRAMSDLGLLAAGDVAFEMLPAKAAYLDFGLAHDVSSSWDQQVGFAGNVYLNQITADPLHSLPAVPALVDRLAARKLGDFAASTWEILLATLRELSDDDFLRLKASPDETFFWQAYRYLVWVAVNTRVRMGVLTALDHPVDFFGAFADPAGVARLNDYPNIRYRGTVDYVRELPQVFHRTRITVDVTNQLAQQSVPAKFFECFAAGGFMLLDRRPDLIATFGDAARAVTYETIDELNAKIDFYLTHESERRDLIRYFQERIRRDHSVQSWMSRIVADVCERAQTHARTTTA